jgi:hypothetical protein
MGYFDDTKYYKMIPINHSFYHTKPISDIALSTPSDSFLFLAGMSKIAIREQMNRTEQDRNAI